MFKIKIFISKFIVSAYSGTIR